ncbi:MAG TPA: penicillin acylase family protein, partial [Pyrinomonadaceae bacterium]|nr:penicillin acylase family protein [Pyrinomonadaceae bacterium]
MVYSHFSRTNIVVVLCLAFAFISNVFASDSSAEFARWERQASNVQIVRDDWGIAHITGKTDADTVFGAIY